MRRYMKLNHDEAIALAKSVTESALQCNYIDRGTDSEDTAKEVAIFYKAFLSEISDVIE